MIHSWKNPTKKIHESKLTCYIQLFITSCAYVGENLFPSVFIEYDPYLWQERLLINDTK
jgi:hypothetical protein